MSNSHSSRPSRRKFLAASSATIAAAATWPTTLQSTLFAHSANDRLRIGCIGLGGMGTGDAHDHNRFGDIVAVCDVDSNHLERARLDRNIGKGKADAYKEYETVLDRNDIDVVSIVTPDHWHTKICVEALEAGKHVFCQKPLTLTLEENLLIRAAVEKHPDCVFMIGTQQRSDQFLFLRAVNMVHKGLLGDITKITCGINGGDQGGPFAKMAAPANLDWDLYLGQAPWVDYIPQRSHGTFRWWYEYSGGKFTDWGAHHIDIALWAAQLNDKGTGPVEIDGTDAKHPVEFKDGYPTSDIYFNTSYDFAVHSKFDSGLVINVTSRGDNGLLIEGTKGRIFVNREKITGKPIEEDWDKDQFGDDDLKALYKGKPYEGHKENFYRCIREGGLPVSDVHSHLQTMHVCHLSAIAARLKRIIKWDPVSEAIVGDEQAASFFARTPREGFEIPNLA